MTSISNFTAWNLLGFVVLAAIYANSIRMQQGEGSEFFSPIWIHKHYRLNWFGTIALCVLFNALCPIWSIAFWFTKLCTFGRE